MLSRELWMTALPDALFDGGYFAFRTPNTSNEELDPMPWALDWKGSIRYTFLREMLFEQGRRMARLSAYEDLLRLPGKAAAVV